MPSGACVVRREGKRGATWSVKYRDAAGAQVWERLGREADGWTRRKAEQELRHRLTDVKREGLRKPRAVTLETFAHEWLSSYPDARGLKRSTRESYASIVDSHLAPALGHHRIDAVDAGHVEGYIAAKRRAGLSPGTINRHLNVLNSVYAAALRRRPPLAAHNPVKAVDRPREPRRHWRILSPAEVGRVERAFRDLAAAAKGAERAWCEQARVAFLVIYGVGLRRGELLGLRWRDVNLADPDGPTLRVRETWVRGAADTPKSEAGERTIALDGKVAGELFDHRGRTSYAGDDERVFPHPEKGTPLDPKRYAATFRLALARAKVEGRVRPFHDGRHSSITNAAAAGLSPAALMARAGHSDFGTTQGYIDLAGVAFREEAEVAAARLWGASH